MIDAFALFAYLVTAPVQMAAVQREHPRMECNLVRLEPQRISVPYCKQVEFNGSYLIYVGLLMSWEAQQ